MEQAPKTAVNELNEILKRIHGSSNYPLLPDEVSELVHGFLSPDSALRPRAYVVLSAFCQSTRKTIGGRAQDDATKIVVDTFGKSVVDRLSETNETSLLTGICFLIALFQVDSQSASSIFSQEGLIENLMDSVELSPSELLCQEVAHLLGQACGDKRCRGSLTFQVVRWLEFKSRQSQDPILQASASVALIKLSKAAPSDGPENGTPDTTLGPSEDLAKVMVEIVLSKDTSLSLDAVEGLAYLSTEPDVKEILSKNTAFLKRLFAMVPKTKTHAGYPNSSSVLTYGVLVIIYNLTSYRPRLSEEQQNIEKLKRMAKAGKGSSDIPRESSTLDDDAHTSARIQLLVGAGVLPVLWAAASSFDSPGVRDTVGRSLRSIVEERSNRGKVLQAGGAKVLQTIIKHTLPAERNSSDINPTLGTGNLEPIQALAKLAITASPVQVFGPNVGAMYDAIRPLSILLQHPSSNLLQRFEAIMALTNLASHSPEMTSRIAKVDGLLNKVELLLLEDHVLVRRASMELICNLIAGSDETFERYGGQDGSGSSSKIHILLALSDVDDLPTMLAASGAIATLTTAPGACKALIALQFERHRFTPIMAQLIDPTTVTPPDDGKEGNRTGISDAGLVHRAVVCVYNVFNSVADNDTRKRLLEEAQGSGLIQALVQLVKGQGVVKEQAVLHQAAGALKAIKK